MFLFLYEIIQISKMYVCNEVLLLLKILLKKKCHEMCLNMSNSGYIY